MSHFWRASGMSYLKYVNIASAMVRKVLKEPFKSKSNGLDDALFISCIDLRPVDHIRGS